MTELEQAYDHKFNALGKKIEFIYLDALPLISVIDEKSIVDNWGNFVIIPPSKAFAERLSELVQQKHYGEILGEKFDCQRCIFDTYGFIEYKIDSLHVFDLRPIEWIESVIDNPQILPEYIRQVKKMLGPQFPAKVKGYSVIIAAENDPNRKNVVLTTYDDIEGELIKNLFLQYANWLDIHAGKLTPQFQIIADEIRGWLLNDYQMTPTKDGFINWYMDTKMQTGVGLNYFSSADGSGNLEFDFGVLRNILTPNVLEQDLQDYCGWRQKRYQDSRPTHTPKPKDTSNIINSMPLNQVEKWFMQLANRKNKDGETFLSEDEVRQFINQAFLKSEINFTKLKVNYGRGEKWNFVRLFFDYYWHCTTNRIDNSRPLDERPSIRDEYIKLLTDNFEDFEFSEVKKNFSNKVGRTWTI